MSTVRNTSNIFNQANDWEDKQNLNRVKWQEFQLCFVYFSTRSTTLASLRKASFIDSLDK